MNILRRGVWALAGLLLPAVPMSGRAASFDCAKATAPHDKLICADAALSRSDETLAALYEQTRAKLSPEGRRLLLEGQRGWLKYLHAVCPLEGPGAATPDEARKCLAAEYETRLKELDKAVQDAGPFRLMQVESFEVYWPKKGDDPDYMPDDDPDAVPMPIIRSLSAARIDAPATPETARLNEILAARAKALTEDADRLTNVIVDFKLSYATPQLLSLAYEWYFDRYGAAHPNHGTSMVDLLPASGRELKATDLFDATKPWADFLARTSFEMLKQRSAKDDVALFPENASDIRDLVSDPRHWALDGKGLTIHFNVYEVSSYADGDREVTHAWETLKPYLVAAPPFPVPPQ